MAELVVTQDELALRRRARRRLVGAVAIALTVVVILPMLFDNEPKPLGPEVDIHIPAHDSPFEPSPALAPPVKVTPSATPEASAAASTEKPPQALPAEPTQAPVVVKAEEGKAAAPEKPSPGAKADSKAKTEVKPASKPDTKPESKSTESKPTESKPKLTPDSTFASKGYYLQLGAFGNESNARQLLTKATSAGFNAVMVGANGQYRVRIGPIPQHERALEMQAKLKAKGFSPVMLGP